MQRRVTVGYGELEDTTQDLRLSRRIQARSRKRCALEVGPSPGAMQNGTATPPLSRLLLLPLLPRELRPGDRTAKRRG
ncbi:hypothetical protein SKAU_G00044390, partial [Synaphobranchus kaupii]